jgi:predicted DNA-binding protein YlxM (UPF0122 family)
VSEDVSVERLSVVEAADALGVTRDAIHKRINRGTIQHEKGEDGRFYVYVDTSTEGLDSSVDKSTDESKVEVLERFIESHEKHIAFLERELERRGDEAARLQQAVFTLTQANAQLAARLPELEAPHEVTEDAETVEEASEGSSEPRSHAPGAQETTQRPQGGGLRGLRRRILGW